MEVFGKIARIGNRVLNIPVFLMICLMLFFGGYSLWFNYSIDAGAFISDDLMQYKPVNDGSDSNPTLAELMEINEDVVAWLTIDDTNIDYPVVQGETDMEYINKDVYGDFVLSGSIFLSCLNSSDFSDNYNLVYGHHMSNGAMFGDIENFLEDDYFNEHTSGNVFLINGTYTLEIFACLEVEASDTYIYGVENQSNTDRLAYIQSNAVQYRDIGMSDTDKIIAFSTCSDLETNGRIVLIARMS